MDGRTWRRAAPILGALACVSAVAAVLAAHHATPADSSPVVPAGAWRSVWTAALAVGFAAYVVSAAIARSGRVRLRVALLAAVIVQAVPLAAPLLLSRDVYVYWSEARVAVQHHANPYEVAPSAYPRDPGTHAVSAEWRDDVEHYGPLWVGAGAIPAALAGSSRATADWLYRALAFLGIAALLAVLAFVVRDAKGLVVLGWNPLIALHFAGGGHNDVWMMLAAAGALVAGNGAARGGLWAVAAAFKDSALVFVPLELARYRGRDRRFWLGLVATGAAIVVVANALFHTAWIHAAGTGLHGSSPLGFVHFLREAGLRHRYAIALSSLAFGALYVVLLREAWRTGRTRLALAAAALCMCSGLFRPWYVLWPVVLAAIEGENVGLAAALAVSGYALFADAVP